MVRNNEGQLTITEWTLKVKPQLQLRQHYYVVLPEQQVLCFFMYL